MKRSHHVLTLYCLCPCESVKTLVQRIHTLNHNFQLNLAGINNERKMANHLVGMEMYPEVAY